MTDETTLPEDTHEYMLENSDDPKKTCISTFTIIDNDDGIQIKISNNTEICVYDNLPNYIIGTIKIDNQVIPVVDLKAKSGSPLQKIGKNSCIILLQYTDGKNTITTGALYEDVSAVLEIISRKL